MFRKIFRILFAVIMLIGITSKSYAANWEYITYTHALNGEIYFDKDSVSGDYENTYFKVKVTDKKYPNKYFVMDARIYEYFLKDPRNGENVKIFKLYYDKQTDYALDGRVLGSARVDRYMGLLSEPGNKEFFKVLRYAGLNYVYPKDKELDVEQQYWNYVCDINNMKIYFGPDSVKTLPDGSVKYITLADFLDRPLTITFSGILNKDRTQLKVYESRTYIGGFFRVKEPENKIINLNSLKDNDKILYNKTIEAVIKYRDLHNL